MDQPVKSHLLRLVSRLQSLNVRYFEHTFFWLILQALQELAFLAKPPFDVFISDLECRLDMFYLWRVVLDDIERLSIVVVQEFTY